MSMLLEQSLNMQSVWHDSSSTPEAQAMHFAVKNQMHDKHVVIPDLHGEVDVAESIVETYINDDDICFVFLGDIFDRRIRQKDTEKGVYRTLEHIKNLGDRAILTIANHEHVALGAVYEREDEIRLAKQQLWLGTGSYPGYEKNTLVSYGIVEEDETNVELFKQKLEEAEHDKLLMSATPYYETDKFIAIHAGIENEGSWEEQKVFLEAVSSCMAQGEYIIEPPHWFSMELAIDIQPIYITDKIVVSGHAHYLKSKSRHQSRDSSTSNRSLNNGKRIRLASQLNKSSHVPAYIWQDWDGKIAQINR